MFGGLNFSVSWCPSLPYSNQILPIYIKHVNYRLYIAYKYIHINGDTRACYNIRFERFDSDRVNDGVTQQQSLKPQGQVFDV